MPEWQPRVAGCTWADFGVLQMAGWPTAAAADNAEQLAASRATALALGARQQAGSGLFAPVLIAACARSAWARGVFIIKKGLVAPCGGCQLETEGLYSRLKGCFRLAKLGSLRSLKPVIHSINTQSKQRILHRYHALQHCAAVRLFLFFGLRKKAGQ